MPARYTCVQFQKPPYSALQVPDTKGMYRPKSVRGAGVHHGARQHLRCWPWSQLTNGLRIAPNNDRSLDGHKDDHKLRVSLLCTALARLAGAFHSYRKFCKRYIYV